METNFPPYKAVGRRLVQGAGRIQVFRYPMGAIVDYDAARARMVDGQLRTNKVTDLRLLEAFEAVPRELFVPQDKRGIAYIDEDIFIGDGRCLMEPMVLARLLQAAEVSATDMVLDIGCGTGYSSAVLARLAATVVALERDEALSDQANRTLSDLGVDNAIVIEDPLTHGYAKQAPYNVILIAAAVAEVPAAIYDQLADGGRLVTVIKDRPGLGRASLMQRAGEVVSRRHLFDAGTPELTDFARDPGFVF